MRGFHMTHPPAHTFTTHTHNRIQHIQTHTHAGARAQISKVYNKQMLRWQQNR